MSNIGQIHFFGGKGAHAQDLKAKKILLEGEVVDIEIGELVDRKDIKFAALAIPISATKGKLESLLSIPGIDTVSFAGAMKSSMPPYEENKVATVHALWGPNSTDNLRLVRASDGGSNPLSELIIKRSREQGIQIIERTREEHDTQMAYHQALTHTAIILHDSVKTEGKILPKTNPEVIADMLLMNPYFGEVWDTFVGYLQQGKSLGESYKLCMKHADLELATQNSQRQLVHSIKWNTGVNEEFLRKLKISYDGKNRIQTIYLIELSRK